MYIICILRIGDCVITVMVPKFADLRDVPFYVHSCAICCDTIKNQLTEKQRKILIEMDKEYEESMQEAMEKEGMIIASKKEGTVNASNKKLHKKNKCIIM